VFNNSLVLLDPSGLKCTTYIPVIHGYVESLLNALGNPNVNPEFDKCDRVGVVCCWMSRGKKVCRDHYQGGEPPITKIDPVPPNWPSGDDVIDTRSKEGKDFIEDMFEKVIPDAMKNQCVKNRCNCTKFTAIIYCDANAEILLDLLVKEKRLLHNPCYRKYEWSCKNKSWDNPDGTAIPPEDWQSGPPFWPPHMDPDDYPLR